MCTSDQDACALRLDGTLVCWGASPDVVDPEATYISIAERCGLGVTSAGEVVHFLGNDFDYPFDSPPYVAVYTDGSSACAVAANGEYDCWLPHADEPGAEPIPEGLAVAFSFGFSTGCLRRPNNEIACWRLFDDSDIIPNCSAPPNAPPGHYIDMDDICGGVQLVDEQGRVHGWSMHREMLWEQTHFGAGNQKVRLAYEGYVVLQADGSLVALQGQGVGPVIPGHYASFSANPGSGIGGHSCAIRLDNHRVVCWGRNNAGQAVPPQQ